MRQKGDINMNKYERTAEQIEEYDAEQKKFILWYLLRNWADNQETNLQHASVPETVSEFYAQEMAIEDIKSARRIVTVLGYEIF
jgi:hypothetical protein